MSVDVKLPFAPFLYAVLAEYRLTLNGQSISRKMWEEQVDRSHTAWHAARKKKRSTPLTEEQWLVQLKADPFLVDVNFNLELAACQYWCRQQTPPAPCSRRRVENWMKKAAKDAVVSAPGGGDPASHAPKPDPGPVGWIEWTRDNIPTIIEEWVAGHPDEPCSWHLLPDSHRFAIRSQMKSRKS